MLLAACLLSLGFAIAAEKSDVLRAGVAKVDITPTKPVALSGYAGRKELSHGIHDPLSARVLAFEQDGKRLVLVSSDLIGFYGETESMRKAILAACQLDPSDLFLTAIHTHSAPTVTRGERAHANNVEYTNSLEQQLVDLTREAIAHVVPVQIGVGSGSSPVGANRREVVQDPSGKRRIVLGRNPLGPVDREVQVLKVTPAGAREPSAVVFAYATHSTSLGPRNLLISGDVHGLAAQFIEKHFDPGLIALPFAGASGDVDPWFRVLPKFETADGWIPEPVLMGTMLGEEVAVVSRAIQKPTASSPIKSARKTLSLPGKPRGEAASSTAAPVEFNVTVGRVGEIAVVGLGGEVFNQIGRAIKDGSPFKHTFVFTHCNGAGGYLPTRQSYSDGGYEVQGSRFAPGADEEVIKQAVQMLKEL